MVSDSGKPALLLVDDESEVTSILSKRLIRRGYACKTAGNGQEALDEMAKQSCPIVVMDVKMPVMDGLTALQHIILLSGHADMQIAVQAMDEGAFGYLMKPVDFDDLLFKIEDADTQMRLEARS